MNRVVIDDLECLSRFWNFRDGYSWNVKHKVVVPMFDGGAYFATDSLETDLADQILTKF